MKNATYFALFLLLGASESFAAVKSVPILGKDAVVLTRSLHEAFIEDAWYAGGWTYSVRDMVCTHTRGQSIIAHCEMTDVNAPKGNSHRIVKTEKDSRDITALKLFTHLRRVRDAYYTEDLDEDLVKAVSLFCRRSPEFRCQAEFEY